MSPAEDRCPVCGASPTARSGRPLLFVGMPDIGSLDYEDPIACVATFTVEFPVSLDDYVDGETSGKTTWTTVTDEEALREWAERNFDLFEIR